MVYMITYDLNSAGQRYEEVIKAIKNSSISWCSYWKSSYLIKSNLSSNQIFDRIKPNIDSNDKVFIVEVNPSNYHGWLTQKEWDFIKTKILN